MLTKLAYRLVTEISPRLLLKAARLWVYQGMKSLRAYQARTRQGKLFPPFLFLAITNACNLRCRGCWIAPDSPPQQLSLADMDAIISAGKRQQVWFYALLGGEPMLHPRLWELIARHPDCYFQIITNGMFLSPRNVQRIYQLGNVTPLVSLDGLEPRNDERRGSGVYQALQEGLARLQRQKILFGIATTVTARNFEEVLGEHYVTELVRRGAMYLWYYVYRPMGTDSSHEYCLTHQQVVEMRRRLLWLRRRCPIVLIDTYWDAEGEAICPAAWGLGFHIGPRGSIEPCPPLSFACQTIHDRPAHLFETINESQFLRGFQEFVHQRTRGCVILECPQELAAYLRQCGAADYSGRDALAELAQSTPHPSHHLPEAKIPENYWLYRFLKRKMFFGMGGYG